MALTLQNLPAEVLLNIIDITTTPTASDGGFADLKNLDKCQLFKALRATCTELNAKLLYFFASKYFKNLYIDLTESNLLFLRDVSRKPIGYHVRTITLVAEDFFKQTKVVYGEYEYDVDEEGSGTSEVWRVFHLTREVQRVGECLLNDRMFNFITEGPCLHLLGQALPALRSLRALTFSPPRIRGTLFDGELAELLNSWKAAYEKLLSAVFTCVLNLNSLSIGGYDDQQPLGLPVSLLEEKKIVCPEWLSSLKELTLYTDHNTDEDYYPAIMSTWTALFKKLTHLTTLQLWLTRAPAAYFNNLSLAMPPMLLTSLSLYHVTTFFEDLRRFLSATENSLRHFHLHFSTLDDLQSFKNLVSFLMTLQLEGCSFTSLNVGLVESWNVGVPNPHSLGISFEQINKMRPAFINHNIVEHEIQICSADGDDVKYCLWTILQHVELTDKHNNDWMLLEEGVVDRRYTDV